ncbi:Cytochrome C oxidase, cbb3-type, subunit III [Daejeonella rubra]|uniref:Cytochrome C oxidase, cbb3-type, subunit III n=1 Tax=Daejeonella rubra TaxID=990371 RepID=A0A1G9WKN5_9SPHI|nr:c-type cytochrome [Daejeonella rubra]SDM84605.1 Cytochrome C oxidase, cbb3-type, subunit III [Daejeonella rubra]
MKAILFSIPLLLVIFLQLISGGRFHGSALGNGFADTIGLKDEFSKSPVLSAEESIRKMKLEDGFSIQIVADEPLLNSPVALSFDNKGRIWVVEMENYMPDTLGTGEDLPTGKIVILSDKNRDGRMDERTVFLDSLVLPRAISFYENGILVAESPNLWFYEIANDKPVSKILVDAAYAEGGNVEHQPNGLFRALDNWIYNAKSGKRYRKKDGKWLIERTHFRGQWGISQDDQGRLFYNNNSENLQGDYFSPGLGANNENQQRVAGFSESIIKNNKVYPIRQTPGVNRAYMDGILDDSHRLVNFTAACGPVIFNSTLFGGDYYGNAFVAEPSANLIKRNIMTNTGYIVAGKQAYSGREFLASTDERFRPVNLSVGPDGALYIVDMYRGIIQHKTYLTPYLKGQIKARDLSEPLNYGRIYKIVPHGKKAKGLSFTNDSRRLLKLLAHSNGWVRNKAQQMIVDSKDKRLEIPLRKILNNTSRPLAAIHALWTMEGLSVLKKEDVLPFLKNQDWTFRMQALSVIPSMLNRENYKEFSSIFRLMLNQDDVLAAPYLAFLNSFVAAFDPIAAKQLLMDLAKKYPNNIYTSDAVISNLKNKESAFYTELAADTSLTISKRLKKVIEDQEKKSGNSVDVSKEYPKGAALFRSICQTCHGADGNGINGLAPPLNRSDWVTGDKSRLIKVILYGLSGPIKIGAKVYKSPEVSGEMPGIASNSNFSDEDIAQVANYIRNSWANKGDKISREAVSEIREKYKGRQKAFTEAEFN